MKQINLKKMMLTLIMMCVSVGMFAQDDTSSINAKGEPVEISPEMQAWIDHLSGKDKPQSARAKAPRKLIASATWSYPASTPATPFGGGTGTEADPYLITSAQELANLAYMVNNGYSYSGKYFLMTKDIVLNEDVLDDEGCLNSGSYQSWTPIGNVSNYFSGNFDGNGHVISGMYFNDSSRTYVGLFGSAYNATISNVGVVDDWLYANERIGGIVGYSSSGVKINKCYNLGTITGTYWCIGGITGCIYNSDSSIQLCFNDGKITSLASNYVAGIAGAGSSEVSLSNCYNTGAISSGSHAAGISTESVYAQKCFNTGVVTNGYAISLSSSSNNCYYLSSTGTANGSTSKSTAEFANGTVLALLDPDGTYFYQGEEYPMLKGVGEKSVEVTKNGITYTCYENSKQATLVSWSSASGAITIPSTVTYNGTTYNVTAIGRVAFKGNTSITSVTIPSTITIMGANVFYGCTNLKTAGPTGSGCNIIYGWTTSIPENAFYGANCLTSVSIPSTITTVGQNAFAECDNLKTAGPTSSSCNIKYDWTTSFPENAFYGANKLTSAIIPSTITSIGSQAFYNCTNLLELWNYSSLSLSKGSSNYGYATYYALVIHTTDEPTAFGSVGNYDFYKDGSTYRLYRYNGNESSITLPTSYNGSTYVIDASAFQNKSFIKYVTIPANVTSIANNTFSGTSLQKVFCLGATPATLGGSNAIPQGTVYVPAGAKSAYSSATNWSSRTIYEGCAADNFAFQLVDDSYLMVDGYIGNAGAEATQTIPSSAVCGDNTYNVTKINGSAFTSNTALTNVVMPSSIEAIGTYAFKDCSNLKSVTLSKNITTLSDCAFQNCTSLESIAILAGTITVGSYVFDGCKSLATVTMKDYVTSIGSYCFRGCESLKSITMSKNITNISSYAFQNCKSLPLVSLTGVVSISDYAYDGCTSISEVSIPANCTSIATTAFNGCTSLKAFTVDASNTSYSTIDGVLTNYGKTQIVAYPSAKGSTYEIPSTITSIGMYAFRGSELTSISIPSTVSTIYNYAFANCKKLTKAVFENNTSSISIRNYIFQNDSLESVEVYRNLSPYYSGSYTPFYNIKSLKSVIVGGNATSLYSSMFQGCTSLNSVTLGDKVTTINSNAFYGCTSLPSLALNDAVTTIGSSAFYGCTSLASIKIPATVTSIGDAFLSGCSALKEINAKMQTPPVLQSTAFTSIDKDACKLIVPADYVETYGETPGWMAFNNIVAEDDASLRKMNVSLTDGGTVVIDTRNYTCEGTHSFYASATEDVSVVITPSAGYYLKSVKQNGATVTSKMEDNTLTLAKSGTETSLDIEFASSTQTTDISTLDYAIYITEVTGVAGKQVTIPVYMKNENDIAAWQADLVLPDGFSIATDSYGDPMISIAGDRTTTTRHSIATSTVNGVTHILCSSSSNKTFSGNDGEVATITLNVADGTESADYPIILKNQVLVESNETGHDVGLVVSKVTIMSYTPGDVNNDGKINAQDLVAIVNYILENPTEGNVREAADLNNDNNVDARDYVAEVNLILSDGSSSAKARKVQYSQDCTGNISIAQFCIAPDEEKTVNIMLDNANIDYSCAQFDIKLPEGLKLIGASSLSKNHSLAYRVLDNGNVRMLLSSAANKTLNSADGIICLTLKADANMANGIYEINEDNGLLVASEGRYAAPLAETFNFYVNGATGINAISGEQLSNGTHYNVSGQRVNANTKGIVIVNGNKILIK